jgi:signal peptidase I
MSLLENENKNQIPDFEPETSTQKKFGAFKEFLWETIKVVIISLIIIIPVRYYVIQPFYVNGASMEPNFYDNEYLIINEISYHLHVPERGDIIVFKYPKKPTDFFIKRVIGLPGEKVSIKNNKIVIYNLAHAGGFVLDESSYLPETTETNGDIEVTLGQDEYYVLGDNRTSSLDSRAFGPINKSYIIGKTWLRGWPINKFKVFKEINYQ